MMRVLGGTTRIAIVKPLHIPHLLMPINFWCFKHPVSPGNVPDNIKMFCKCNFMLPVSKTHTHAMIKHWHTLCTALTQRGWNYTSLPVVKLLSDSLLSWGHMTVHEPSKDKHTCTVVFLSMNTLHIHPKHFDTSVDVYSGLSFTALEMFK